MIQYTEVSSGVLHSAANRVRPRMQSPTTPAGTRRSGTSLTSRSSPRIRRASLSSANAVPLHSTDHYVTNIAPLVYKTSHSTSASPAHYLTFASYGSHVFSGNSVVHGSVTNHPPKFAVMANYPPPEGHTTFSNKFAMTSEPVHYV